MELGNGNAAGWLDRREERGVATLAHGFDVSAIGLTAGRDSLGDDQLASGPRPVDATVVELVWQLSPLM